MKLIIFGYKRHGKDTACEYLRDAHGLTFASSSETACDLFLFDQLKSKYGYATKKECFEDRHNHRSEWFDAIRAFNDDDLTKLGRHIFAQNDVYCGIRNDEEFYALKQAGLFDLAVWIDAGERLPPEDASSMSLSIQDADLVIDNNGTLVDLHQRLSDLHQVLYELPFEKDPRLNSLRSRIA